MAQTGVKSKKSPYGIWKIIEFSKESRRFFKETCDRLEIPEEEREEFMFFCGSSWPSKELAKKWGER